MVADESDATTIWEGKDAIVDCDADFVYIDLMVKDYAEESPERENILGFTHEEFWEICQNYVEHRYSGK